jgi:PPOX class probable F420-dependent enzyme
MIDTDTTAATSTTGPLEDRVRAFLAAPNYATIATIDPDGGPRQAVVWFALEGDVIVLNSRVGRRWPDNLLRDPRISIAVIDAADGNDWVGITGTAIAIEDQAIAQADIARLARRYEAADLERQLREFEGQQRISFRVAIGRVHVHLDG